MTTILATGAFIVSSAFCFPISLTVAADGFSETEKELSSMIFKTVEIDYNVEVEPDEYGIYSSNDMMRFITFDIFTAETVSLGEDEDSIPANTLIKHGVVERIKTNPNSSTKRVYFDDNNEENDYSCSLPKGKYYIKQTGDSNIVTVSEKRTYFTVGEDNHSEYEYIDLTSYKQTVKLLRSRILLKSADENDQAIEDVRLIITEQSHDNEIVVYTGVSDTFGMYNDCPELPNGTYKCEFFSEKFDFSSTNDTLRKIMITDYSDAPIVLNAVGYESKDNNDTSEKSAKELEAKIDKLEEELSVYRKKITGDIDGDGEITSADALVILRYSVGLG